MTRCPSLSSRTLPALSLLLLQQSFQCSWLVASAVRQQATGSAIAGVQAYERQCRSLQIARLSRANYKNVYLSAMAKAYSATTVLPADVCAATSTECPAHHRSTGQPSVRIHTMLAVPSCMLPQQPLCCQADASYHLSPGS